MGWLDDLGRMFGSAKSVEPAPKLAAYPSEADAQYAIQQGFGYGSGNEPYIEGGRANVYDRVTRGELGSAINAPSTNTDLTKFGNLNELSKIRTMQAQAALATNRSAIASLGYDPQRTNFQTGLGPATIGGAFDPETDRIFVNVTDQGPRSSQTHESIHRGLEKLRTNPEAADLLKKLPDEESVVRYMMAKQMGDPEKDSGSEGQRLRQKALNYWLNDSVAGITYDKRMARLEEIAGDIRQQNRPGGPR